MNQIGISDLEAARDIFITVAALQSLSALAAYFIFGGYRIRNLSELDGSVTQQEIKPLNKQHSVTLFSILALVVSVIFFKVPAGVGAFVLAGALALIKIGDMEETIKSLPWGVISLLAGITVLVGLLGATGGIDLATTAIATYAPPPMMNGALALTTGVVSIYSSSSAVVMPVFIPLIPGLSEKLGSGNIAEMVIAVDVGSHMVDVSPLSVLGALCLAVVPVSANRQRLFRHLLLWGMSMAVVGAALAFLFLDWL